MDVPPWICFCWMSLPVQKELFLPTVAKCLLLEVFGGLLNFTNIVPSLPYSMNFLPFLPLRDIQITGRPLHHSSSSNVCMAQGRTAGCPVLKPEQTLDLIKLHRHVIMSGKWHTHATQTCTFSLNYRFLKLRLIEYYPTKTTISKHSKPLVLLLPLRANQEAMGCLPLLLTAVIVLA